MGLRYPILGTWSLVNVYTCVRHTYLYIHMHMCTDTHIFMYAHAGSFAHVMAQSMIVWAGSPEVQLQLHWLWLK